MKIYIPYIPHIYIVPLVVEIVAVVMLCTGVEGSAGIIDAGMPSDLHIFF